MVLDVSGRWIASEAPSAAAPPEALPAPPAQEMNVVQSSNNVRKNTLKSVDFTLLQYPPPITFYAVFVNTCERPVTDIFYRHTASSINYQFNYILTHRIILSSISHYTIV